MRFFPSPRDEHRVSGHSFVQRVTNRLLTVEDDGHIVARLKSVKNLPGYPLGRFMVWARRGHNRRVGQLLGCSCQECPFGSLLAPLRSEHTQHATRRHLAKRS